MKKKKQKEEELIVMDPYLLHQDYATESDDTLTAEFTQGHYEVGPSVGRSVKSERSADRSAKLRGKSERRLIVVNGFNLMYHQF